MRILVTILCALGASTANSATVTNSDVAEYTRRAKACGESADNLLCYFSPEEIQQATGMSATEALAAGLLDPTAADQFAMEDGDNSTAIVAGDSTSTELSARRRYSKRASKSSGGKWKYHSGGGSVMGTFMAVLRSCKPGCVPTGYNVYRAEPYSCHGQSRAIDVGGISCGGRHYSSYTGEFASLVSCARSRMTVLYRNGRAKTKGHHDHAHFSLGCTLPNGKRYW